MNNYKYKKFTWFQILKANTSFDAYKIELIIVEVGCGDGTNIDFSDAKIWYHEIPKLLYLKAKKLFDA
jgi:hypothetical protein